ncbi:hypothetical protein ABTY61_30675 [Kitasatospora sp. NPDC096128]|uniref:hypothetical protein n=1 Tax=Kitasatospora sp. NPDC096128 TaxID=3155547 RepID=UPI00332698BD
MRTALRASGPGIAFPPGLKAGIPCEDQGMGGHASYVWSYLQVMRHSGILDRIAGMVVGVPREIGGLEPGASPTLAEIVLDVLGGRDIPVLGNVDFGHAGPNLPMPVGVRAGLDARRRTLSLLEPAVGPRATTGPAGRAR